MELGTRIYLARMAVEEEFLQKYKHSIYTDKFSYLEMVKNLRTLKIRFNTGETYDIDEHVTGCKIEEGVYATCYPVLNVLHVFPDNLKDVSNEALKVLLRHEFLHIIQVLVLEQYHEVFTDPHGEEFKKIAINMSYPESIASGSIKLETL